MSGGSSASGGAGPWWVVVTGASQGIGRTICTSLASVLPSGSRVIGMARSKEGLTNTAAEVKKVNPNVTFIPVPVNLTSVTTSDFEAILQSNLATGSASTPAQVLVFHNAGSLGPLKFMKEIDDSVDIAAYFNLNIGSVMRLNSALLKFTSALSSKVTVKVINISSVSAIDPFKSWSLYCTGKAGRHMLFKVMAAEYPDIRVLSYSPGPVDTDMQIRARNETQDKGIRDILTSMKEQKKLLSTVATVDKLINILQKDEYQSGQHVDYFDDEKTNPLE